MTAQGHWTVIRISGFWMWLYFVLGLDWVAGWISYIRFRRYYEDMDYRFGCALEHACGLSKTNYDKETMYAAIDERVRDECENYVEEGVAEGWLKRVQE